MTFEEWKKTPQASGLLNDKERRKVFQWLKEAQLNDSQWFQDETLEIGLSPDEEEA